jgi:hypothetical protein
MEGGYRINENIQIVMPANKINVKAKKIFQAYCESQNSHLAIVMSTEENNFLKAELRKHHIGKGNFFCRLSPSAD